MTMKFKCPYCNFEGEFEKGKLSFWIDSLLFKYKEQERNERRHICPKCKTEIILPEAIEDKKIKS